MKHVLLIAGLIALTLTPTQIVIRNSNDPDNIQPSTTALLSAARQAGGTTTYPNPTWASAGVQGGILYNTTKCGSTLASSSTIAQVNAAITACSSGYVELGAGTFTLAGAMKLKSNVVVRGQGMNTVLNFTALTGSAWDWGSDALVEIKGSGYVGDLPPTIASASNIVNWTGTNGAAGVYTQGATLIDLSSATSYAVGDMIALYQSDLADASLPASGFFVSDKNGVAGNVNISQQGEYNDHDAAMTQRSIITAKSGNQVTISPGLMYATGTWQTALSPKAGRTPAASLIQNAGIEDMQIQSANVPTHQCDVCIAWGRNVWMARVGLKPRFTTFHTAGAVDFAVIANDSINVEIRDSWIDKMIGGGVTTTTSYGVACQGTSLMRVENIIFNNVESPTEILVGCHGIVIGYNYELFTGAESQEGGIQQHSVGSMYALVEGNSYRKMFGDNFHGSTALSTYFRNHLFETGFNLQSYHRWYNLIGNAITATVTRKNCVSDASDITRFVSYGFRMGYASDNAVSTADGTGVNPDTVVCTSTMLWGNYTSTGGSVFDSTEVPSSDPVFPNPVPSSNTLPSSLYLSARPGFFTVNGLGTQTWPGVGPDVTGGNFLSGHAYKTPAQKIYEATTSNAIANFDPWRYGQPAGSQSWGGIFSLTENPLAEGPSGWTHGGTTGLDWHDWRSTAGIGAYGTQDGTTQFTDSVSVLNGTWGNTQMAWATVRMTNEQPNANNIFEEIELLLRFNISAHSATGYEFLFAARGVSNQPYVQIVRWNGALGDFTYCDSGVNGPGLVDGDVISATISGTTLRGFINGVQVTTCTDATYSSGKPGIGHYLQEGTSALADDFGITRYRVVTR